MNKLLCALLIIGLAGCSGADKKEIPAKPAEVNPLDFESVKNAAMSKDYQAQRNLAYGYVSYPYKGQDMNPILGCAWYKLIILSGSDKVNVTDTNNVDVYCNKLPAIQKEAAENQARELKKKIYP